MSVVWVALSKSEPVRRAPSWDKPAFAAPRHNARFAVHWHLPSVTLLGIYFSLFLKNLGGYIRPHGFCTDAFSRDDPLRMGLGGVRGVSR